MSHPSQLSTAAPPKEISARGNLASIAGRLDGVVERLREIRDKGWGTTDPSPGSRIGGVPPGVPSSDGTFLSLISHIDHNLLEAGELTEFIHARI